MNDVKEFGLVDSLRITVLMEDYAGYEAKYWGSHGIALLLDITSGTQKKRLLLDVGQSPEALIHNMEVAGIEPGSIDMIFISHCHYDHTLALSGILERINKEIPVIGHPDIFRKNYSMEPFIREIGATDENKPERLIELGAQLILVREPFRLMQGVISTGEIKRRTDFEGAGIGTYNIENGRFVPDGLKDDMSLVLNLKGKGLMIATGCSHAGIINIIEHARDITGIDKLYGIIGGLHLIKADDRLIGQTIDHMENLNPDVVIPGHCTGHKAQYRFWERFGDRYRLMYSGKVFEF
jgi:7,8-dihydropterin-6-yl-methyl-4-(beta-D-ribofuranosyl)aminobenzene 5'-phosphate synthase